MLIIRREQMDVFDRAAMTSFVDRTVTYQRRYFPRHFAVAGAERVRMVVRLAVDKAAPYGILFENTIRSYADHMMMLGCSFDEDPQLPWAREILTAESISDQTERMDRLHAATLERLEAMGGESAYVRALELARGSLGHDIDAEREDVYVAGIRARLEEYHAAKCESMGSEALSELIRRGRLLSADAGLHSYRGAGSYTSLMFLFGSGFASDPLFPWAKTALLEDARLVSESERIEALGVAAREAVGQWLGEPGTEHNDASPRG